MSPPTKRGSIRMDTEGPGGGSSSSSSSPASPSSASSSSSSASSSPDEKRDAFDRTVEDLLRRRKSKPLASRPSTLGGVPTSKATGFGKIDVTKISVNPPKGKGGGQSPQKKSSFVGIGKPLNDINNPEYDDQGYTLYADEETGEKKRVFEALVTYPSLFTMKIVGAAEGDFAKDMVQVVADSCECEFGEVEYGERRNGKWTSVTVQAPVKSAEMLYGLYERIDLDPRVKFKF
uniref:Uncharacterized protein n=1 Tax=Trieres chinensis TaxID=1514140 RepID=A0A7S2A9N1_TRICV|mmetsp:Transcript_6857/g.14403  ORF Transcript_6857/g.14403 Transcript_6857/m.14403 type:complete len:233 (+) Transcript_6857:868-1566(+)